MGLPSESGPSEGRRAAKRPRTETESEGGGGQDGGPATTIQDMATTGYSHGGRSIAGTGSAWEGQMASLATDNFMQNNFASMRNNVHETITTSSHVMSQGGNICSTWTRVPAFSDVLQISMGHITGNSMMGHANLFNQYYLCRLRSFKVIFKDIVVALEASSSLGLQVMSDVITEWRRRPQASLLATAGSPGFAAIEQPNPADYPDWWGDWRPATDGAVEFNFNVSSRQVPAFIAAARSTAGPKDPTAYMSLAQFLYGHAFGRRNNATNTGGIMWATVAPGGDFGDPAVATNGVIYHPYAAATSFNWLDYFFEWRARNCPNSTSAVNTSAIYNIQIDAVWEMEHRITDIHNTVQIPAPP